MVQPVGPGVEEALYDSLAMRQFVGIDLGGEPVPDETTLCKFRHLLERHDLGAAVFQCVHENLEQHGLKLSGGTIVDASIIHAPSSTKNAAQERDPEMHHTKKGNQWCFGMNAHIGVDSRNKVIHAVVATAANVADATVLPDLLHGEETRVWAKVEHCSGVIKRVFSFTKVRYRGLAKNANRLFVTCALSNLFIARHRLLRLQGA